MRMLATALLGAMCTSAFADTVIHVRSAEGGEDTVSIKGSWARLDGVAESNEYMVGDLSAGVVYVVVPAEQRILALEGKPGSADASAMDAKLVKRGAGPDIAGFATHEYELMANGVSCGKTYVSTKAAESQDVRRLLDVMEKFNPESLMPEAVAGMMRGNMSVCDRAQLHTQIEASRIGLPMKTVDQSGRVEQEVTALDTSKPLSATLFELPAGYQRTTPEKLMQDAIGQMDEMMKNVTPEQQEMMRQMMEQFGQGAK